ncbi:hypothetical protein JR316_0006707 [Psilocybe cubensis]|uniref:Fe2OG dioxygenase domain-containing protein n=2 Tax=Psilocybe cubensis TaxID=181762 RepID=A0A8H8CEY1_PSICU|nr:hypothetical protein JR316_0006707 [Psilocybe cubensis]KAH9480110.1 hypothetical protein JR316_0006707 [Psilocybe cubensis]
MSSNKSLKAIQSAFSNINHITYCSGAVSLTETTSKLYYTTINGSEGKIDFSKPTDDQLAALAGSCQKATFGVEKQDVLDETYRKAGKLDATQFAINFSPLTGGILDTIRDSLLGSQIEGNSIEVELYKLNVYGPGSFFKSHVDTPRNENMFGSLVVVLPTVHEGGSLIVRHAGNEQVFDTALAVRSDNIPKAAFVAFYSDVEHEVTLVTSGYRVTLTYNLYLTKTSSKPLKPLSMTADYIEKLKQSLAALLADPNVLPNGGLLGFSLAHRYPIDPKKTELSNLIECLKGSDADTLSICKSLSIDVSLKAIYYPPKGYRTGSCLVDQFVDFQDCLYEDDIVEYLAHAYNAKVIHHKYIKCTPIVWIKKPAKSNFFKTNYLAHGNEPALEFTYADVCLVANIDSAAKRNVK